MRNINGDELISLLEASTNLKIGILDNNSTSFFYKIKQLGNIDEIFNKYNMILIPQWVYLEITDSEQRFLYLQSLESMECSIYIIDELEYEQVCKYKSQWLYKFFLNCCFINTRLKDFLKRYVEKNNKLEELDDYKIWLKDFYDRGFEGEFLSNGRIQKKNAGEISICLLALIISYNYNRYSHSITIISSDRDTYDYLKSAKEQINKDRTLKSEENITVTFKSNDFVIKEIYLNNYLFSKIGILTIVEFRDERRIKYTINSPDGSIEEHDEVVKNTYFKELLDDRTFNIIF